MSQVSFLGRLKRAKELLGQFGLGFQNGIFDHQAMIDGINTGFSEVGETRIARIRNQRLNIGRIHTHVANCRGDLARQ